MRSERMELIRRELEDDRTRMESMGLAEQALLDATRPWDAVFLGAAGDEEF